MLLLLGCATSVDVESLSLSWHKETVACEDERYTWTAPETTAAVVYAHIIEHRGESEDVDDQWVGSVGSVDGDVWWTCHDPTGYAEITYALPE